MQFGAAHPAQRRWLSGEDLAGEAASRDHWALHAQQRWAGSPSRFLSDRAEAERAFALAERLGSVNAAAQELGTTWPSLRKAFTRHGLDMPARNPEAVRQRAVDAARQRSGSPVTPTLARISPVHAVLRGAADGHPFAAGLYARMLGLRLQLQAGNLETYLGGSLRPGLSAKQAAEHYSALLSPELYHLLTVERRWTTRRYASWVTALLDHDLLG